ncbi:MAG: transketolase [Bacteroidetes bacterium]|nr:transketolase [Bacteroidota bacterium]
MSTISTYQELIKHTALNDERYIVMTAENRAVVKELPPVLGNRFIDTGITEQTMIGMAAGLALRGRVPICHALAPFLIYRAYEFVRTDVGIAHLPVKLSAWIAGFLSDGNGPTHQAIEDVALMRTIPGMTVFCPSDHADMVAMLPEIWASPDPAYVRVNVRPDVYGKHTAFKTGVAEVISEGTDVTLLTYGMLLEETLKAAEILKNQGLSVGLLNMRSLKPVDEKAILKVAATSKLVVTVEDHFLTGGLYSIVAEVLLKNRTTANFLPLALNEKWFKPGLLSEVLVYEGFTGPQIAERVQQHVAAEAVG